jgi:hypothetical protein
MRNKSTGADNCYSAADAQDGVDDGIAFLNAQSQPSQKGVSQVSSTPLARLVQKKIGNHITLAFFGRVYLADQTKLGENRRRCIYSKSKDLNWEI